MAQFDGRVQGSNDNCNAKSGAFDSANPLQFGRDGKNAENDLRMFGRWKPQLPSGAVIASAYLYVTAQASNSDVFYTEVKLISQNGYNCPAFTSNPWTWTLVGLIRWPLSGNLPDWTAEGEYQSPTLKSLIEIWLANAGDPLNDYLGLVITDGDAGNNETREGYSYSGSSTKALRLVINYSTTVETIIANDFPRTYLESPIKAKDLRSKVSGATITYIAKDFPGVLLKKDKAKALRSKWT